MVFFLDVQGALGDDELRARPALVDGVAGRVLEAEHAFPNVEVDSHVVPVDGRAAARRGVHLVAVQFGGLELPARLFDVVEAVVFNGDGHDSSCA